MRSKISLLSVLTVVLLGLPTLPAAAQRYKIKELSEGFRLPDKSNPAAYRRAKSSRDRAVLNLGRDVKAVLDGSFDLGQNQSKLDTYFNGYLLPLMTHYESDEVDFGSMRQRLVRDTLARATGRAARDYLLDGILFPFAKEVVQEDYHPAARVNAMALIAALDRDPARGTQSEPVPMSECLDYMLNVVRSENAPEFLRIPAMQGIERHLGYDFRNSDNRRVSEAQRQQIQASMLEFIDQQYSGEADADDVLYFKQRIAVRTLGLMQSPGTDDIVLNKLQSLIVDTKARPWLRVDAVEAFSQLDLDSVAEEKWLATADASVKFLIESLRGEASSIAAEVSKMRENALVYTGKDLANEGSAKDEELTVRKASAGLGGDFEKQKEDDGDGPPKVDLPNYRLNLIRRKMKLIGDVVATTIAGERPTLETGLIPRLPEDRREDMFNLANEIRKMLRDLDVAVMGERFDTRDYTAHETFLEPITERLRKQMVDSANSIKLKSDAAFAK